ncbi:Fic family protein [Mesorhizobium sp. CAU 1732]|uniref:Fic/DOC family protein n=1 Tax=Mesorhizobium sp. CAU 1732 TaxID=3140358 RepID=UPI003261290C
MYVWAGEIRTIRIGKGGNWFCYPEYIMDWLTKAFDLYGDPDALSAAPPDIFARKTAKLLADINATHPFREGNGRTQLTFLTLLAANSGFEVDDEVLDPERVLSAMVESFVESEASLAALIQAYIG